MVLTPHGTVSRRTLRRQAGNLRVQPNLVGKLKSRVQDPALSQAKFLKVGLAGETCPDRLAEEQNRVAQREQMEGLVDDRARAEVTRPLRSIEDDNDKDLKRQQLGGPLATNPEEVVSEETSDMMTDDTGRLGHEETRRERFNKKTSVNRNGW